jgi:hypothetical protein
MKRDLKRVFGDSLPRSRCSMRRRTAGMQRLVGGRVESAPATRKELAPAAPPASLAPEAKRLAADVAWLAADAREGRRAGTGAAKECAGWLSARMKALGLEPAGSKGFLQDFEVALDARDGGRSTLDGAGSKESIAPLFCSEGGEARERPSGAATASRTPSTAGTTSTDGISPGRSRSSSAARRRRRRRRLGIRTANPHSDPHADTQVAATSGGRRAAVDLRQGDERQAPRRRGA